MTRLFNLSILTGTFLLAAFISGCKKDDPLAHSSGSPMTVESFTPGTGGFGTSILISGSNFSGDTSQLKVTINGKRLTITGANAGQIMAVVPKRCGDGKIVVTVGNDSIVSTTTFKYLFTRKVTTLAGNGKAGYSNGNGKDAQFSFSGESWYRAGGIAADNNGNVYVADPGNHCIRKIDASANVTVLAGNPGGSGYADGKGLEAKFAAPYGLTLDAQGNIYTADPINYDIRKITPDGEATTIGFGAQSPWSLAIDKTTGFLYYSSTDPAGAIYRLKDRESEKIISNQNNPAGIGFDKQGNLYVSGNGTNVITQFKAGTWTPAIIAGQDGVAGYANGVGTAAKFASPWGLALDTDGNIYVAGNGTWDGGAYNPDQSIRFIEAGTWNVSTYAGSGTAGYTDGLGESAAFSGPLGVAVDKNGTVYVVDKNNNCVRKIVSE